MKNKIGWCDMTFNPVWGCLNHCEYCYARKMAGFRYNAMADKEYKYLYYKVENFCKGEFANRLRHFVPTSIQSNFDKRLPKKPQRIFVGSMSEIYYWNNRWMMDVLDKTELYPQHTFIFLTKFPEIYSMFMFPENCWLGVTITNSKDSYSEFHIAPENKDNIFFICIEPMLDYIPIDCIDYADWVIIGAETGKRKGKVIPKKEWIWDIVNYCQTNNMPVYVKDSIVKLYSQFGGIKEFPKEAKQDETEDNRI